MQRTLPSSIPFASESEEALALNVVIAYENFESGKHAKTTYDYLARTVGRGCRFSNQMWKFDVLSIPQLREMARQDVQEADIFILACQGGDDLPEHVKDLVEEWLRGSCHALALVALFPDEVDQVYRSRGIRSYLRSAAKCAGAAFFAHPGEWRGCGADVECSVDSAEDMEKRTLETLAGAVQKDFSIPRWGINE